MSPETGPSSRTFLGTASKVSAASDVNRPGFNGGTAIPRVLRSRITGFLMTQLTASVPRTLRCEHPEYIVPADPRDPYADFTNETLDESLAKVVLDSPIGSVVRYSNYG